jgi:hypothetical protein
VDLIEIPTPRGPARAHLQRVSSPRGALVLGHGAAGGVNAPDLQTTAAVAMKRGLAVALIEQPYRVAGRRSPAPAAQLDVAFATAVEHLREAEFGSLPVIVGGRSSGARVACRTANALAAAAVLCLAFPLLAPRRANSSREPQSRLPELEAVSAPILVVQGSRDRFGIPPAGPNRNVIEVTGDHSLRSDAAGLGMAVTNWLEQLELVLRHG